LEANKEIAMNRNSKQTDKLIEKTRFQTAPHLQDVLSSAQHEQAKAFGRWFKSRRFGRQAEVQKSFPSKVDFGSR
jgi:hypothetical protein